jgi:SAM-dependent methyltransferase
MTYTMFVTKLRFFLIQRLISNKKGLPGFILEDSSFLLLFKRLAISLKVLLPFSRIDVVRRTVCKDTESILDIGCGEGLPMKGVRWRKRLFAVGADQSAYFIKKSKLGGTHDGYVLCNAKFLPFKEKAFDIVLCLETLYALPKHESITIINTIQKIARKQIILSERVGAQSEDVDPWGCRILSTWFAKDFDEMGFEVRGSHGLRLHMLDNVFSRNVGLKYIFSYMTGLPAYFMPRNAQNIICSKKLRMKTTKTLF